MLYAIPPPSCESVPFERDLLASLAIQNPVQALIERQEDKTPSTSSERFLGQNEFRLSDSSLQPLLRREVPCSYPRLPFSREDFLSGIDNWRDRRVRASSGFR